ncbi:recombinase RecT [Rhizorhabdus wittichii]|uniref:Recombinase RecT n=2 Tax=Rhizorhabdus wittichii TaxID=160791 RepID=A0A975CZ42_9SPHN|nr:recombinase RecT [Rhizorhabdus wittichii]
MGEIEQLKPEITAVLPVAVSFDRFRVIVMMAVRTKPEILDCHGPSVVTACLKAAYDGLMPDGRQAAIIPSNNKVTEGGRTFWRKEARYGSMVAGLRMQIIKGGKVDDVKTEIVYANEVTSGRFKYRPAAAEPIVHDAIVIDSERGPAVGAYSVAFLSNGRVTAEYMTEQQILDVRDEAQSGPVWKGKFDKEMWRKTVLRRHRKALPGCNDIIDMEAREMFPQFAQAVLPAPSAAPTRPDRRAFQQIDHVPDLAINDFGRPGFGGGEMSDEEMEIEEAAVRGEQPAQQQMRAADPPGEDGLSNQQPMPETPAAWEQWADRVKTTVLGFKDLDQVNAFRQQQQRFIDACPAPLSEEVSDGFFDAIANLTQPGTTEQGERR